MTLANFRVETEKGLKQDKLTLSIFLFSVLSILLQASLILTASEKLPHQLPLFYSRPWGEPMLAPSVYLWVLPLICAVTSAVNYSLGIIFFKDRKFLCRTLFIFSLVVAVATLYDTVKIISLLI